MKIIRITFLILGFGVMAFVAIADEMKNTEVIIASENTAVTGAHSYPFTLYLGDNISGVTNPLKSLTFIATGVYTSSADEAVTFMIDSDGTTEKIFTLPNTSGVATPFNLEYKVPASKINPASAGSYSYSLDFNSGATMYGLAIKMREAHRYVPPVCPDGDPGNQKMKTTETIVASENLAFSSMVSYPITFYIGDVLTGVTNPVKSVVFNVTGVYIGDGNIIFDINGNGAKSFILPDVGTTPTPFDIAYTDSTNTINPASAGSYGYTLGVNPSGVTVYGLGIKMTETHRYAPPACGGLPVYGDIVSAIFDSTESGAGYNSVMWKGTTGTGKVMFQFASSDCLNGASNYPACTPAGWNYIGSDGTSCGALFWYDNVDPDQPRELSCSPEYHNNHRYYRYKVRICSAVNCTDSGLTSPEVQDIIVNWAP